jgi:hypothetical protein
VSAIIFVEGGGDAGLDARCREGFHKLVEKTVAKGHNPKLVACGSRGEAYKRFCTQIAHPDKFSYVGLWVDSEDAIPAGVQPWAHLMARDHWAKPAHATDDNVLFMTTCMETWCVADRESLKEHYGTPLLIKRLPALENLEARHRHDVQEALERATEKCKNAYAKGKRSFALLAKLSPAEIAPHCPQFVRTRDLLRHKC